MRNVKYDLWVIADSRNNKPLGVASYATKEFAERQIEGFRLRDGKGGRPELHGLIPFMVAVRESSVHASEEK